MSDLFPMDRERVPPAEEPVEVRDVASQLLFFARHFQETGIPETFSEADKTAAVDDARRIINYVYREFIQNQMGAGI